MFLRSAVFARLALILAVLPLAGCFEDPQREEKLKWREEEVNAKEAGLVQREMALARDKQSLESLRLDLLAREKSVELLQKQLAEELEKSRRVRREIELRVPLVHRPEGAHGLSALQASMRCTHATPRPKAHEGWCRR